ncbi:MAG: ABC transporter substrate-binding protein [Phototrophicaceae bacterium]
MSNNNHTAGLSRRNFLKVFAAGAAGTVGSIALGPLAGLTSAQESGTLRVAWLTPASLDPRSASGDSEIGFLNAVYDYLINTDAASNLLPALASSWEVSEDGLQYTLQIREDATFHDGSALTVDDVVWTINWQKEAEGTVAGLLSNATFTAGDGNTLIITLEETNPDFLFNLTDNKLVILKSGAEGIGEDFNGTGAFILEEYLPGDRAIFTANENYWDGAPTISRLEFIYFDDQQAGISAVQGGLADAILRLDNASFLGFAGDTSFTTTDIPTSGHHLVRIRADQEPGNDVRVRQAFKLATDRQAIWDRIQIGFGAPGKDSPIGPAFGAYFLADAELPARDPAAAAALLAEAGYPDGLDMTLHVPNSGNFPDLASTLAAQWEPAGIRVEIQLEDENSYYVEDWLETNLGVTGWGSRPFPQFYFDVAYETGAIWNESHYSNARVDELIAIARTSVDQDERTAAYQEIQQIMLDEGPIIVPYFFAQFMVTGAGVSGVELQPFAGRTRFNTATVS